MLGDYVSTGLGVLGLSWQSSPALTEVEEVDDRLDAADGRPLGRVERRHPGHGVHEHARRAPVRARSARPATRSPAAACRPRSARSSSTSRRTATARSTRRRCSPASGAPTSATCRTTRATRMRADALDALVARGSPPPARRPAPSSPRRARRRRPRSIRSARSPRSRGEHGLWLHVDAAMAGSAMILPEMPRDVGRASRTPTRWSSTRTSGSAPRSTARSTTCATRAPRARDVHQPELPADRRRRPREEPAATGASRSAGASARSSSGS